MYYTLGQRQGLRIGGRRDAGDAPWYVVDKRVEDNALVVDQGGSDRLLSRRLLAGEASWIGRVPAGLDSGIRCAAKIRYRQADQACVVSGLDDGLLDVEFDVPQRAAAPGQYVVFYEGDRCLGGAVIERIHAHEAVQSEAHAAAI